MSIGIMDFGDSQPELEHILDPLVTGAVNHHPAIAHDAVVITVLKELPASLDLMHTDAVAHIAAAADRLAERGDITKVSYTSENVQYVDYYPRGTTFKIVPAHSIAGQPDLPHPMLSPAGNEMLTALVKLLNAFTRDSSDVIVRVVNSFCERCGSLKQGHVCNK